MGWTEIVLIIFIVLAVVSTVVSVIVTYAKKEEKRCYYHSAATIVKEKYLNEALMNPHLPENAGAACYGMHIMAYIKNISIKPKKGFVFDVGDGIKIGRNPDSNILLGEATVSGKHCYIYVSGSSVYLRDMSANGTYIKRGFISVLVNNGITELRSGDVLIIGTTKFRITIFNYDTRLM